MVDDRRFQAHRVEPEVMPSPAYAVVVGILITLIALGFLVVFLSGGQPPAN
jgi:hypothetical protein